MRRHSLSVMLLLSVAAAGCAKAQPAPPETPETRALAERMRAQLDAATEARDSIAIRRALGELEAATTIHPRHPWLLHYRGYAVYSLVNMRMQGPPTATFTKDLVLADSLLEQSGGMLPLPETVALRASIAGLRAGAEPDGAMMHGMRSTALMQQALGMGPRNPRVLLLAGMSAMYTPEQWGGGAAKARELFARAESAFAADAPPAPAPRWGRSMLAFFRAQVGNAR